MSAGFEWLQPVLNCRPPWPPQGPFRTGAAATTRTASPPSAPPAGLLHRQPRLPLRV